MSGEGNINVWLPLLRPPTGDMSHSNPGMCPSLGIWRPFGSQTGTQSMEWQQQGPCEIYIYLKAMILFIRDSISQLVGFISRMQVWNYIKKFIDTIWHIWHIKKRKTTYNHLKQTQKRHLMGSNIHLWLKCWAD